MSFVSYKMSSKFFVSKLLSKNFNANIFRSFFFLFHSKNLISNRWLKPTKTPKTLALIPAISMFSSTKKVNLDEKSKENPSADLIGIINEAEKLINTNNGLDRAKSLLLEAIKQSEGAEVPILVMIYELLAAIAWKQGSVVEVEERLVCLIERLHQMGLPENHNHIIRIKLKLCRLNELLGNDQMAEIGFRNLIEQQEEKLRRDKDVDAVTNAVYISCLFWYGRFLVAKDQVERAEMFFDKALGRLDKTHTLSEDQEMMLLYNAAETKQILENYDDAIVYIIRAISICKEIGFEHPDFPLFVAKLGTLFIQKKMFENARFWCETGRTLAETFGHQKAKDETNKCFNALKEWESKQK